LSPSRRAVLGLAAGGAAAVAALATRGARAAAPPGHRLVLRVPPVTTNGARVPVVVEMEHPMEPDHHVTRVEVVNARDPVPSKGVYHLTPASGRVHLAFPARLDEGESTLVATAECSRHGPISAVGTVRIPPGGGGCTGAAPAAGTERADDIGDPVIRIPQLVAHGRIRPDEIVTVQVKTRHPVRTGLERRDGTFVQASPPFYLAGLEAFHDGDRVSRFVLTAALSDNPLITFAVRARREGTLAVVLTNSRGQRFHASHPLRFG
jgi:sulfur-oxidizing protein SoxY